MSMEKLLMQVALVDQVTKPLQGITQQVQQTADAGRDGLQQMATGAAGLAATGFAVKNALMPAIEMDRKLGEVKSLGVHEEALQSLQSTALEFSAEYGKSAVEFTGAAYDIQSAIAGLKGDELAQFTKASGVLAAATKSDTATITDYMGTMYGIFKNQANEIGKAEWVQDVAGKTATAVQMFKTTGSEMSRAFESLGADANSAGISMNEQMAILGQLQATMSGSEAGTKYRAFLAGVGKAQDQLGLKFTDAQGNMLPMMQILDQLKGRYGETLEVAESVELNKAFGSTEATAMLKLLMSDADGLAQNIEKLGQVKGMSQAEQMAADMTDEWERLESSWFAIRAAAFGAILPSINAIVGSVANGITTLTEWTNQYPLLGEVMGYAAIAALSLGGVVSLLSLAMGIGKFMSAGWAITMSTLGGAMRMLRAGMMLMTAATWAMNAALFANPITWIVLAVVALIGAVAAMIYYWDDLKATFGDMAIFQMLGDVIDWVIEKLNMIPGIDIEWRANEMPDMPDASTTQQVEQAKTAEQAAPPVPSVEHLTKQPRGLEQGGEPNAYDADLISYKNPDNIARPPQSVVNNINGNSRREGDRISQFGDVHIHSEKPMTPQDMAEWEELNVGG
ncbi:phage tail tape measure protein [Salinivibrio kushneri]|uniref:Phage tail tape measure protein n=1 Tax=Salinivibrio kushneri TaxID=1908198 RepID=A0AB36K8V5_9GAMM|nr:phage tail tape measure protein [Salinivibrio kushneri]OOE45126.1 phage tail tape measure protein [Salinivibrio kushneri]